MKKCCHPEVSGKEETSCPWPALICQKNCPHYKEATKQHIHADVIKAWADGAEVQFNDGKTGWTDTHSPGFYPPLPVSH